ncbi:MAG TPA: phage terminase small subunit [Caproiciproducens sp.]|nr:phage terminase small subunit [Caproiciproducens sp.]
MPKPRSPNRDKAHELWKKSRKTKKLKDIAVELGVSESLVRKWKNLDHWEKKTLPKGNGNIPKKQGAQIGNKNAVGNRGGHGAPLRNTNAEKHGAYSKIYFDTLDEDERALLESVDLDEEQILLQQIRDLTIKARRLKRRIKEAEEERGGLSLDGVVRERTPNGEKTTTITTSTFDRVIKLEAELDKTQGRITKATDTLIKYREEQARLSIEQEKLNLSKQELERRKKSDESGNW